MPGLDPACAPHGRAAFCSRFGTGGRKVVTGAHANVCDDCLRLCREFMALEPA